MKKFELQKRALTNSDGENTVAVVVIKLIEPVSVVKRWSKSNKKQIDVLVPNPFKVCNERIGGKLMHECMEIVPYLSWEQHVSLLQFVREIVL